MTSAPEPFARIVCDRTTDGDSVLVVGGDDIYTWPWDKDDPSRAIADNINAAVAPLQAKAAMWDELMCKKAVFDESYACIKAKAELADRLHLACLALIQDWNAMKTNVVQDALDEYDRLSHPAT